MDYDSEPFVGTPIKKTLRLVNELCSVLSPVCRAATDASGTAAVAVTQQVLKKAEDILRRLDPIWGDYLDEYMLYEEPFVEAKKHVVEILATRRDCLTTLLTAHAWALRASNPLCGGQLPDVSSLLQQLYNALRVLMNDDPGQLPAHRQMWMRLVRAFVATQPAEAAAAMVHAHRKRVAACRGEPAVEVDALLEAIAAWNGATKVADVYIQKQIGRDMVMSLNFIHEIAVSGIAEQLCGLRAELAEDFERIWPASDGSSASTSACASSDAGAGTKGSKGSFVWHMDELAFGDARLLELLDEACKAYSTGSSDVAVKVTNTATVHVAFGPMRRSDGAAAAAVLHPAVQYLLGWWLAGTAAAAEGALDGSSSSSSSSRAWGLPEAMVRHVQRMEHPRFMSLMALRAAGVCWQQALQDGMVRTSPRRRRAAAAGTAGLTATAGVTAAGASGASGQQPAAAAPGSAAAAAAQAGGRHPVPYSHTQMYDMCIAALVHCCWWDKYDRQDDRIVRNCLSTALDAGVGVVVQCLLRMGPEQAACRLAAVWRVALQCADSAGKDPDRWGWRVAQLLCEVPLHLQQQQQQQQGQQQRRGRGRQGRQEQQGQGQQGAEGTAGEAGTEADAGAAGAGGSGSSGGADGATASSPGPLFGQHPHNQDAPGPGPASGPARAPGSLALALECDLLPYLEATLRSCLREAARPLERYSNAPNYRRIGLENAAVLIDLALRRHGHWPAALSYGDSQAAAALVVTMGKAARAAVQGAYDSSGRLATEDPGLALRLQLLALLEQLGPQHGCHVAVGGGATGGGSPGGSSPGGGGAGRATAAVPDLLLNRKVGGATRRRDARGAAAGGSSSSSSSTAQVLPAWASGPSWQQVKEAGGCPAPGTPLQLQLARLAALAAAEWLPALLTRPHASGFSGTVSAVPMAAMLTHGSYRVAWAWLRHVARQALGPLGGQGQEHAGGGGPSTSAPSCGAGPAGNTCHTGWTEFLLDRLAAVEHVRGVLVLACGDLEGGRDRAANGAQGTPVESRAAAAAAREVLPAALDVLGAVALAAPGRLRAALVRHGGLMRAQVDAEGKPGWVFDNAKGALDSGLLKRIIGDVVGQGCTLPWNEVYLEEVEVRQGRPGLGGAIRALLQQQEGQQHQQKGEEQEGQQQGLGQGGDAFWGSAEWLALREEMQVRFRGGGTPQVLLPGPPVDPGFPRCGYAACVRAEGRSEAGVRLQACGRCRSVGYCCVECQRADWAAGHKAACGGAGAGHKAG